MTHVPASSHGGGGFTVGSSHILGNITVQNALAAGALVNVLWTQATLAGTDLSRNADGFTVDVATDGWYIASLSFSLSDVVGSMDSYDVTLNTSAPNQADIYVANSAAAGGADGVLTTPPMHIGAGGSLSFNAIGRAAAGTWKVGANSFALAVVRLS